MSIVENIHYKQFVCYLHIRLNFLVIFFYFVVTMNVHQLIEYMDFMINVKKYIKYNKLGKRRYNIKLWKTFIDCFNCLPVAALIDDRILCMHGGLSPDLQSI